MDKKFKLFTVVVLVILGSILCGEIIFVISNISSIKNNVVKVTSDDSSASIGKEVEDNLDDKSADMEFIKFISQFESIQHELTMNMGNVINDKVESRIVKDKLKAHNNIILTYPYVEVPEWCREYFSCIQGEAEAMNKYIMVSGSGFTELENEYLGEVKMYVEKNRNAGK